MTAAAERGALRTALAAAIPTAALYAMPPASIAGLSLVIAPDGWRTNTTAQVDYQVSVSVLNNGPDTTQALEDLEANAAIAWKATAAAGWQVGDMNGPEAVTYADQPYLAMTFTARRITTL